jgi:hypothetical protein
MKWHARCDKCGTYAEGGSSAEFLLSPTLPVGWAEVKTWRRIGGDRLWVLCQRCAPDVLPVIERAMRPERREPE